MVDDNEEGETFKRYRYIGYTQDFPVDMQTYSHQPQLLLKLARDAVKKRDFYKAMRYLNIILMNNPNHQEAKFYKRQVMEVLEQLKKKRNKDLISF